MPPTNPPQWLHGVWQREFIQRGEAPADHSVTVRYLQTPSLFFDIRVGAAPGGSDTMSFGGKAVWEDETQLLRWHAAFNTDGSAGEDQKVWADIRADVHETEDQGNVRYVTDDCWFEAGDGYTEKWTRLPDTTQGLPQLSAVQPQHMLVVVGDLFGYASTATTPHTFCCGSTRGWRVELSATVAVEVGDSVKVPQSGWRISEDSTMPWPAAGEEAT